VHIIDLDLLEDDASVLLGTVTMKWELAEAQFCKGLGKLIS
jgi:hypothetical protein